MITTPEQMREAAIATARAYAGRNAERTINAIRAIPIAPHPVAVAVKPLVWVMHPNHAVYRCDTPYGTYKVFGMGPVSWDFDSATKQEVISRTAGSVDLAKAAAQADYESRILSSLTIHPADPLSDPRVVALVDAARTLADAVIEYGRVNGEQKHNVKQVRATIRAIGGEA